MRKNLKKNILSFFSFFLILCTTLFSCQTDVLYASERDNSVLMEKVSKSYTKKFCNSIGFGLSKDSAMNFSYEENKQVFKKQKEMNNLNKDLLAEEIAISVVEQCGYPINLSGEKGILDFKDYYLSKEKESLKKYN